MDRIEAQLVKKCNGHISIGSSAHISCSLRNVLLLHEDNRISN